MKAYGVSRSAALLVTAMVGCNDGSAGHFQGPQETGRQALPNGRIVDLTYPFDEQTVYWPTAEGFRLEKVFAGVTEAGYYYTDPPAVKASRAGDSRFSRRVRK